MGILMTSRPLDITMLSSEIRSGKLFLIASCTFPDDVVDHHNLSDGGSNFPVRLHTVDYSLPTFSSPLKNVCTLFIIPSYNKLVWECPHHSGFPLKNTVRKTDEKKSITLSYAATQDNLQQN